MYFVMSKRMNSTPKIRALAGHLGLAHTGRPVNKKQRWAFRGSQPGPGALDRGHQRPDGVLLAEDDLLAGAPPGSRACAVGGGHALGRYAAPFWPRFFDVGRVDLLAPDSAGQPHVSTGLVHNIDGLSADSGRSDISPTARRRTSTRRRCIRCHGVPRSANAGP